MNVYFIIVSFNVCLLRMRNCWRDSFLYSCSSIYKHKFFIYFVGRSSTRKCIYERGVGSAAVVRELVGACDWPGTVLIPSLCHHIIWFAAAKATRRADSDGALLQNELHSQLFYCCALHNTKVKVGANVIHLNRVQRKNIKCVDEAETRTIEVIIETLTTTTTITTPQTATRINKSIASSCQIWKRFQPRLHRKMIVSRSGNGGVSSCQASSLSLLASPSSCCGEPSPSYAVERSPNFLQMTRNRRSKRRHGRASRSSKAHS